MPLLVVIAIALVGQLAAPDTNQASPLKPSADCPKGAGRFAVSIVNARQARPAFARMIAAGSAFVEPQQHARPAVTAERLSFGLGQARQSTERADGNANEQRCASRAIRPKTDRHGLKPDISGRSVVGRVGASSGWNCRYLRSARATGCSMSRRGAIGAVRCALSARGGHRSNIRFCPPRGGGLEQPGPMCIAWLDRRRGCGAYAHKQQLMIAPGLVPPRDR